MEETCYWLSLIHYYEAFGAFRGVLVLCWYRLQYFSCDMALRVFYDWIWHGGYLKRTKSW